MRYVILALLTFASLLVAAPNREPGPNPNLKSKPDPPPWHCQFGKVTQQGDKVVIEGNPGWFAEGHIRKDGKLLVCWTRLGERLETAAGLYAWKEEGWIGCWGWSGSVELDTNDNLAGETYYEHLHRVDAP